MSAPNASRSFPNHEAYEAYWNGDSHRALALFYGLRGPGYAVMRARTFGRLRRHDRTLDEAMQYTWTEFDAHEGVGLAISAVSAYSTIGDFVNADRSLESARQIASKSADRILLVYTALAAIHSVFCAGDLKASSNFLTDYRMLVQGKTWPEATKPYQIDALFLRINELTFLGYLYGAQGMQSLQNSTLLEAAISSATDASPDRFAESNCLWNLATLVNVRDFEAGLKHLRSRVLSFPWGTKFSTCLAGVQDAIANNARLYSKSLEGNSSPANAPSLATRMSERVDALMFQQWRDSDMYLTELRFCVSIAFDVDWPIAGTSLPKLLFLAVLVAPFDRALARKFKQIFDDQVVNVVRTAFGRFDRSQEDLQMFVDGVMAKSIGSLEEAVMFFDKVKRSSTAHAPLKSIAGIESYSITKADRDLDECRSFQARYPGSSFSGRLQHVLFGLSEVESGDFPYLGVYGMGVMRAEPLFRL